MPIYSAARDETLSLYRSHARNNDTGQKKTEVRSSELLILSGLQHDAGSSPGQCRRFRRLWHVGRLPRSPWESVLNSTHPWYVLYLFKLPNT